jgi:hypothetical protein
MRWSGLTTTPQRDRKDDVTLETRSREVVTSLMGTYDKSDQLSAIGVPRPFFIENNSDAQSK